MTEQKIVELLLKQDEKGMNELLVRYSPLMKYIITPILPNEEDREDCLSEVSMRIWETISNFDSNKGSLNIWITTVTRNYALNFKRNNLKHSNLEELDVNISSNDASLDDVVINKDLSILIKSATDKLSKKEQILFYRKYYYLQSTAQIAAEMSMTERAVEGKLYRIKKKLREIIGGDFNE